MDNHDIYVFKDVQCICCALIGLASTNSIIHPFMVANGIATLFCWRLMLLSGFIGESILPRSDWLFTFMDLSIEIIYLSLERIYLKRHLPSGTLRHSNS